MKNAKKIIGQLVRFCATGRNRIQVSEKMQKMDRYSKLAKIKDIHWKRLIF